MSGIPTSAAATPNRASKMASPQTTNLNHLLNFTLPPRQSRPPTSLPRRNRKTGDFRGVWNKERFVNAQYRFVMNPTGDYTVHFADPDIYFQWHDIMQVIIPRSSALAHAAAGGEVSAQGEGFTTCPICLASPTAPRMTKCGHVFCFPCILHYLGLSDTKWARCPICFDSVNEKQLKCVKWFEGLSKQGETEMPRASSSSGIEDPFLTTPKTGSILRMRLMQRPQITTLALPRSHTWPSDLLPPHQAPFHFLPDVFSFSKFMLATPAYLITDLTKDLNDLAAERRVLAGMNDTLGVSFIDGSEQRIRQEIAKVAALDTSWMREQIEKAMRDQREIEERFALDIRLSNKQELIAEATSDVPTEFLALKVQSITTPSHSSPSPKASMSPHRSVASQTRNAPRHRRNLNPPPPSTSTYFYYQAASGLTIFLHPLDIRILLSHFNSYASFPDNISVRVEAYSEGTVNDDLRKRCKYLAHLPEGADVVFVEADLRGVVGTEGLKNFENALKMRSLRRKEKGKKDDRAKARVEEREREKERSNIASWSASSSSSVFVVPDGTLVDDAVATPEGSTSLPPAQTPQQPQTDQIAGAWGTRSFASALHSPPLQVRSASGSQRSNTSSRREDDHAWDMDVAWHELERRLNSGGRKKRGAKLVVLGGGGGGKRR
ncbi:hypothetical protein AX17_000090 [Amanita inopinata Kibby_2008]|nr:hypothetical protein AX17_000090 [Amanita inopinata Kibby_2008]